MVLSIVGKFEYVSKKCNIPVSSLDEVETSKEKQAIELNILSCTITASRLARLAVFCL